MLQSALNSTAWQAVFDSPPGTAFDPDSYEPEVLNPVVDEENPLLLFLNSEHGLKAVENYMYNTSDEISLASVADQIETSFSILRNENPNFYDRWGIQHVALRLNRQHPESEEDIPAYDGNINDTAQFRIISFFREIYHIGTISLPIHLHCKLSKPDWTDRGGLFQGYNERGHDPALKKELEKQYRAGQLQDMGVETFVAMFTENYETMQEKLVSFLLDLFNVYNRVLKNFFLFAQGITPPPNRAQRLPGKAYLADVTKNLENCVKKLDYNNPTAKENFGVIYVAGQHR